MNKKRWWCMDCRDAVQLNRHGRCGTCESEAVIAVDQTTHVNPVAQPELNHSSTVS